MDVDSLTKEILSESKFVAIRSDLQKLEVTHVEMVLSGRNNEENNRALLERSCWQLIQQLKGLVKPNG